ncbi:MAG TPA: hypothetical protein GXX48_11940 [Ochrobactrum intermedium]|uniref:Uncharacterized protein n=1 Tax=Brucella intermedia TaxID=94625 RepID=A0A7V6PCA9_9HYPH|nr:hypothetical protein [Brucella intermedia]HHV68337.1 hypothetical protein [Brucella intermedia]
MSDVLDVAIAVRGGQLGWDEIYKLKNAISLGGTVWHVKSAPGAYLDISL